MYFTCDKCGSRLRVKYVGETDTRNCPSCGEYIRGDAQFYAGEKVVGLLLAAGILWGYLDAAGWFDSRGAIDYTIEEWQEIEAAQPPPYGY